MRLLLSACVIWELFAAAPWGALPAARAGAWTQQPGAGQIITAVSRRANPITGFAGGPVEDDSTYTSLFFEYGVMEGLTVGGTVFIEVSSATDSGNNADFGVFARARIWQGEGGDVAAVQLGVKQDIGVVFGDSFTRPDSDPTSEVSLRALYGRGFGFDWGSAFVSLEAGYHFQTDGDDDEVRADITVGAQPWSCCMGLLSLYATYPVSGEGDDGDPSLKLAPSFAYSFTIDEAEEGEPPPKPITIQIGISQDLLNFDEGLGFQFSVWQPF
ncbi:hypothetical protein LNKW23_34380 [Paralimibaculum aggregatum]|uniref:Uncharacterized protein n=1 Tax=Paralimibaculum aggregatum TaxID=3036245 RepID=A0ABQ6LR10_9RHOB|nr:hypothetical protein [Limibaculum sp. NKW23]GMG84223.1 hypothetical protein LNKW23_34380 [Limibaculum sp. NKW23]